VPGTVVPAAAGGAASTGASTIGAGGRGAKPVQALNTKTMGANRREKDRFMDIVYNGRASDRFLEAVKGGYSNSMLWKNRQLS